MVGVSWYEALAYTRWLSATTGLTIRLPTEAEWERAERGDDGRIYPWGNEWVNARANIGGTEDGYEYTAPVGSYPDGAGPYDALDMAGNVWEWTNSHFLNYPYSGNSGWEALTSDTDRVVRGGSRYDSQNDVRGANRYFNSPGYRDHSLGFRVVVAIASR